ncbi:MAG TPA: IS30 family transposase [Mycobacteriales bacterium]|nr:IS30 family transposase [Mycobacteriales bacterium]
MPGARLTESERVRIEALWTAGWEIPAIAVALGRHRSTVWREIERHNSHLHGPKNPKGRRRHSAGVGLGGLYRWGYHAGRAHDAACESARRRRPCRLGKGQPLRPVVIDLLRQRWSPQQIAARLVVEFPDRPEMRVSHETIYQALYVQSRGNLREELARQVALRSGRVRRRAKPAAAGAVRSRRPWVEGFHITSRPALASDRAVPGHWEGDLVIGAYGRSAILTLVERSTRYVMLGALPDGRASEAVITVLSQLIGRLPVELRRSLTWDQGVEMARHAEFTVATGCPVYFCDPHSPWQRGSNENTNGLLRQYFPKSSTDFRQISQDELDAVARELNGRPRMTLQWQTPAEALNSALVATAA